VLLPVVGTHSTPETASGRSVRIIAARRHLGHADRRFWTKLGNHTGVARVGLRFEEIRPVVADRQAGQAVFFEPARSIRARIVSKHTRNGGSSNEILHNPP